MAISQALPRSVGDTLGKPAGARDTTAVPRAKQFFYERFADEFDSRMNRYDTMRRVEIVFDELLCEERLSGKSLLDAGCGTGWFSKRAAELGGEVTSLDVGPRLLKRVAQKCRSRLVVGDTLTLQFRDESFDLVVSSEVIEHTASPRRAVAELIRVAKVGGTVVLTTPNRCWYFSVWLANRLGLRPYRGMENWVGYHELRRWCESDGCEIQAHLGFHLIPCVVPALNGALAAMDRYGESLGPVMVNTAVKCVKRR